MPTPNGLIPSPLFYQIPALMVRNVTTPTRLEGIGIPETYRNSILFCNYSGILNNRPHGCFIDNILRNCRRGFIPRSSKWPHRNRGINPLLQFSQSPSHENFLVSSYYPSAFILEAKPNFVLILSGDLGYGDLSCYSIHMIPHSRL